MNRAIESSDDLGSKWRAFRNKCGRVRSNSRCVSFSCFEHYPGRKRAESWEGNCFVPEPPWLLTTAQPGARSRAEFAAKIGTVVEETDETVFWLDLIVKAGVVRADRVTDLVCEANELLKNLLGLSTDSESEMTSDYPITRSPDDSLTRSIARLNHHQHL